MGENVQDPSARAWVDSEVAVEPRSSDDTQHSPGPDPDPDPSLAAKPDRHHAAEGSGSDSGATTDGKETSQPNGDGEVDLQKELPPHPLKRRPTSARPSTEIFRNLSVDDDDSKSKRGSFSAGDRSSIYTVDSTDERRLSGRMRKVWRGVMGAQKPMDPLEQWMVKHSGGVLRDVPVGRLYREPSDR
ncbi:hypothetical protein SAMD00023353_0602840 [Rosellinia necatrix]|uniref:Uncharacterized protein n=1 Tax=Rosellinia necatrix TaxID=77044 RepID=A0A1S7UKX8_ROSNE|nr:hypothetical protein SAMD00023353_0602840 [Rosellinia necatrix]